MPIILEWDVQQTHMGMMVRGSHTYGHIVYINTLHIHYEDLMSLCAVQNAGCIIYCIGEGNC